MDDYIRSDSITKLDISSRLLNLLLRNDIKTIGELLDVQENQWQTFHGFGAIMLEEAHRVINELKQLPEKPAPERSSIPEEVSTTETPRTGVFYEKALEEYPMSVRLHNCLHHAEIDTVGKLLSFPESQWSTIRNMGAKTIREVMELVETLKSQVGEVPAYAPALDGEKAALEAELEETYAVTNAKQVLLQIDQEHPGCTGETLLYIVYENPIIQKAFYKKIFEFLTEKRQGLKVDQIRSRLPRHLQNTTILEEAILNLENEGKIQNLDEMYLPKFPSILEYVATLPNDKKREIITRRLSGQTLEDVGTQFNLTRERVRQICNKVCNVPRTFEEDRYRYPFETYEFDQKSFTYIFQVPATTYRYLEIVCKVKRNTRKPLSELLTDDTFPLAVLKSAETYIYRDYLSVDGHRIPKNRPELFRYIVKTYCRDKQVFSDVVKRYNQFLEEHGLADVDNLQINSRSYENRISDCNYALTSFHHGLRYYNIPEYDYTQLVQEIDLSRYHNMEISTLKIFREQPDIMEQYDIRDEFELHNLLRKIWPDWGNTQIHFGSMPTLQFGNYNVDDQVLNLLVQCAPISAADFAKEYENEYGVKATTAAGNCFHCIDPYLVGGLYTIDQESLPLDQHNHMKEVLLEEFYTLTDIQRLYEREFPNETRKLNSYNIKTMGFLINSTYAVSSRYSNAAVYFRHILTSGDVVDTGIFPRAMVALPAYQAELGDLRNQREIIEFSPRQYINIHRLEQVGTTKRMLEDYCKQTIQFVERNTFFTVESIRQDGFSHELDDLYFEEWFYSSLLAEDHEHFSYRRMGGSRLFYSGKSDVQLTAFLEWILEKEERMDLDDLIDLLDNRYGIRFQREKLTWVLKDANLYYDQIMDRVYIDYDTYFEEI